MAARTEYRLLPAGKFSLETRVRARDSLRLCLLDLDGKRSERDVTVVLGAGASAAVTVSCFAAPNARKAYRVRVVHGGDAGESAVAAYAVAARGARVSVSLLSDIRRKTSGNSVAQVIRGALLSDSAQIRGEPQLVIDDNDVKATHAMAIGRVDPEQLFYLQSRGVPAPAALRLVLAGYFGTVIAAAPSEAARAAALARVDELFAQAAAEGEEN